MSTLCHYRVTGSERPTCFKDMLGICPSLIFADGVTAVLPAASLLDNGLHVQQDAVVCGRKILRQLSV